VVACNPGNESLGIRGMPRPGFERNLLNHADCFTSLPCKEGGGLGVTAYCITDTPLSGYAIAECDKAAGAIRLKLPLKLNSDFCSRHSNPPKRCEVVQEGEKRS